MAQDTGRLIRGVVVSGTLVALGVISIWLVVSAAGLISVHNSPAEAADSRVGLSFSDRPRTNRFGELVVPVTVEVTNTTSQTLTGLRLTNHLDFLDSFQPGDTRRVPGLIRATMPESDNLRVNRNFDAATDTELLDGTAELEAGEKATIYFELLFGLDQLNETNRVQHSITLIIGDGGNPLGEVIAFDVAPGGWSARLQTLATMLLPLTVFGYWFLIIRQNRTKSSDPTAAPKRAWQQLTASRRSLLISLCGAAVIGGLLAGDLYSDFGAPGRVAAELLVGFSLSVLLFVPESLPGLVNRRLVLEKPGINEHVISCYFGLLIGLLAYVVYVRFF